MAYGFQAVPPAPGRPTPGQATEQAPSAPAGQPPPGEAPGLVGLLFPVLLLLPLILLMFWSSRSQQKKAAALLASLKKGDRVLTQSGLVGKLVDLGDRYAKLEIAPGVKVDILKSGLTGKDTGDTATAEKK